MDPTTYKPVKNDEWNRMDAWGVNIDVNETTYFANTERRMKTQFLYLLNIGGVGSCVRYLEVRNPNVGLCTRVACTKRSLSAR